MWLIAVHGEDADFVRNLTVNPRTRLAHRGRWCDALASVHPLNEQTVRQFNRYARSGLRLGIDPRLVRVDYAQLSAAELNP